MSRTGIHLEFHHMMKSQTDGCLESNSMRTIIGSELVLHLSTKFARRQSTSEFGIGCAARAYSMIL